MKKIAYSVVLIAMLSLSAFAASGSAKMTLMSPGLIAGKELPAGNYKVTWAGEANDVQVTIMAGKKTLLTAPAKVVEMSFKPLDNAVVKNPSNAITEMRFEGKKTSLVFAQ